MIMISQVAGISLQIVSDSHSWDAQNNRSNGRYTWPFIAFVDHEANKEGDNNSTVSKTIPGDEFTRGLSKSECVKLRNVLDEWEEPVEELEVVSGTIAESHRAVPCHSNTGFRLNRAQYR